MDRCMKCRPRRSRAGRRRSCPAGDTMNPAPGEQVTLAAAERRLLLRMPLHAITSVHGEPGLRERLLLEITRFPAADAPGPGRQWRWRRGCTSETGGSGNRTSIACCGWRSGILSHYRVTDPDVACAALLHDTVEDHAGEVAPGGTRQDALAVLAGQFGQHTADPGGRGHQPGLQPGRDEHEQYREHVAASLQASPWAQVIKASDSTDNAVGLFRTAGPKLSRLAGKYRPLVPVLRGLILRPDTPLGQDVKLMIAGQLGNVAGRLAVICGDAAEASGG